MVGGVVQSRFPSLIYIICTYYVVKIILLEILGGQVPPMAITRHGSIVYYINETTTGLLNR